MKVNTGLDTYLIIHMIRNLLRLENSLGNVISLS